jgi:hypothetical protein
MRQDEQDLQDEVGGCTILSILPILFILSKEELDRISTPPRASLTLPFPFPFAAEDEGRGMGKGRGKGKGRGVGMEMRMGRGRSYDEIPASPRTPRPNPLRSLCELRG